MPASRASAAELDAAATLLQHAAASALGPDTAATEAEGTAAAETAKALVDTAVTTAVLANHSHAPVGKQWEDDPTTLNIVTAGARPSLEKQPSPDDVSHQFTAGPAEAPAADVPTSDEATPGPSVSQQLRSSASGSSSASRRAR